MSLQQNINNSIFSLAHLKFMQGISKDSKQIQYLFKDINEGKYAMTPEEVKEAENTSNAAMDEEKLAIAGNEVSREMRLEENRKLANESNKIKSANPNLTPDEAQMLARTSIMTKQEEYKKSRDDYEKQFGEELRRAHERGELGF